MTPLVQEIITVCEWFPSSYLIFSQNAYSPLLYYSYFFAVIPSILVACVVFLKNRKSLAGKLLISMIACFSLWSFSNLVVWATELPPYTMFFWSVLIYLEPLVYFFAFYFLYVFLYNKDFSLWQKMLFSLPLVPTLILTPTRFGILGYNLADCDRNVVEGIVATYGYAIEIVYIVLIIGSATLFIRKVSDVVERKKAILITIGITLFLLSFSLGNIIEVFTENWTIGQYGLFGAPIFVAFLGYLIVRYQTFNMKLLGTQVLVLSVGFLVSALLFVRRIENVRIVVVATIIFICILGYLLIKSVKTEVKQRERLQKLSDDLSSANEKLKGLDKLKSEFLSLAAHQLRSPLTAIKGYTSMLLDGDFGAVNDKQKEAVNRVFLSSQNLARIVEDLLDVTKIEQGGMQFSLVSVDAGQMVEEIVKELSVSAKTRGLELTASNDNQAPYMVFADNIKIRQVFLNLIDNSIKYTEQGFVKVSVSKSPQGKILIAIADSGIGISPETKEKLFGKFNRGEGGKMNTGGSGLGLYLVKQIIEAHHGRVWVESEGLGHGSTFMVELDEMK